MAVQQDTKILFGKFAEQVLLSEPQKSLTAYALESLLEVMRKDGAEDIDENLLRLWIATMVISGKKPSTVRRYFGRLHALYLERVGEKATDVFEAVAPVFSALKEVNIKDAAENLSFVKRLLAKNERSFDWQTTCIFFYLLYTPAASITDAAELTFADVPRFCPQIDDIISSFSSSHGRKYVFALRQGKSRPHEIDRRLTKELQQLLSSAGMQFEGGFSRASITSLWITAALKCGVSLQDIRACIGIVPQEYAVLSILGKCEIDDYRKERIICAVADSINDYAMRWFVMKLRQGVSVSDIKDRIDETLPGRLNSMTLYYPTRSEIRKEGRKRIEEEIPYLPNVLFFKTQSHKVKCLFANIGDLAWCYKTSNSSDSSYAIIPNRQMSIFQQCIGSFTSDIKMDLVEGRPMLEKGRKVRITGGIMAGYEGEILDVAVDSDQRIFFLSITDDTRARWTVHVEDVFIQPLA